MARALLGGRGRPAGALAAGRAPAPAAAAGAAGAPAAARWPRSTPTRASPRESPRTPRWSSSPSTRRACGSTGSGPGPAPGSRDSWGGRGGAAGRHRPRHPHAGARPALARPGCPSWWPAWTPTWRSGSRGCPATTRCWPRRCAGNRWCSASPGSRAARRRRRRGSATRRCASSAAIPRPSSGASRPRCAAWTRSTAPRVGHGLISVDPERGVVRRVPLLATLGGTLVPVLGLEMLRVAAKAGPRSRCAWARAASRRWRWATCVVPTEPDGSVLAALRPARSVALRLGGRRARGPGRMRSRFEGRLVLIGVTALGLSDYQATPVARSHGRRRDPRPASRERSCDGELLLSASAVARWIEVGGCWLGRPAPHPRWCRGCRRATSVALLVVLVGGDARGSASLLYLAARASCWTPPSPPLALAAAVHRDARGHPHRGREPAARPAPQVEQQREAAARLAGELEAARRIQMGTLPRPAAAFPGETRFDLYALLEPAREVGGDLYDFFLLDARSSLLHDRRRLGQGPARQPVHGDQQGALQEHRAAPPRPGRRS